MGLPEDTFVDMHRFDAVGESSGRFWLHSSELVADYFLLWLYSKIHEVVSVIFTFSAISHMRPSYPRSEEEEERTKNVWLKGHTGICNLCQPLILISLDVTTRHWEYHDPLESTNLWSPNSFARWCMAIYQTH